LILILHVVISIEFPSTMPKQRLLEDVATVGVVAEPAPRLDVRAGDLHGIRRPTGNALMATPWAVAVIGAGESRVPKPAGAISASGSLPSSGCPAPRAS
jgi:hypothetical protein